MRIRTHLFPPMHYSNSLPTLRRFRSPLFFFQLTLTDFPFPLRLSRRAVSFFLARAIFLRVLSAAPLPSPCRRRHKELYIFFTRSRSSRPRSVTALLVHALPSPVLFLQLFPFARASAFYFPFRLAFFTSARADVGRDPSVMLARHSNMSGAENRRNHAEKGRKFGGKAKKERLGRGKKTNERVNAVGVFSTSDSAVARAIAITATPAALGVLQSAGRD